MIPCLPQSGGQGRNAAQEGEEDHHEHEEEEQGSFCTRGVAFPCFCITRARQEGFLNAATLVVDLRKKGQRVVCYGVGRKSKPQKEWSSGSTETSWFFFQSKAKLKSRCILNAPLFQKGFFNKRNMLSQAARES